jgi:Raf kinase inhibitor-like YbhB/YbcL family protein
MARLLAAVLLALGAGSSMAFELTSTAFAPGQTIPEQHGCDGKDASPPLAWKDPPATTKSFALICEDPDAPAGTWVHWLLWNVPASARGLPEAVGTAPTLPDGARQGTNDFKKTGWGGPCPPRGHGPHRYVFRVFALDTTLDLPAGAKKGALEQAVVGHTLARAELIGHYERR